jgi:hypothetical protein
MFFSTPISNADFLPLNLLGCRQISNFFLFSCFLCLNTTMLLSGLPHELILNVYRLIYDAEIGQLRTNTAQRRLWCLQLLSTCMVCRSWYTAGSEYLAMRSYTWSFLSLDSLISCVECPTLSTSSSPPASSLTQQHKPLGWLELFMESKRNNLQFHGQVRRLVLDLSPTPNPVLLDQQQRKAQHTLTRAASAIGKKK